MKFLIQLRLNETECSNTSISPIITTRSFEGNLFHEFSITYLFSA